MVSFYGDYNLTETVNIPFNTFSSDDPSASVTVTDLVAGDVYVHQDGVEGTPTGITVSLNVGTVNGNHLAILDLSDTNDVGFYANGSRYQVRIEGVTIDGATINAWIGAFSIGCTLRPATAGRTLAVESDGVAHADLKEWLGVAPLALAAQMVQVDLTAIHGTVLTETAGQLAAGFKKLFDVATPVLVASDVMRGTDSAALASVVGALADAAAAGDPTSADTLMQYAKQIVNTLEGTAGVPAFPAEAGPANDVSMIEVLRAIHADVTGLNGSAMVGTNSAALAGVCTEGRLAELDAANLPADVDTLLSRITATLFSGITTLAEWLGLIAGKQAGDATALTELKATGAGSGTFDPTADSNEAIADGAGGGGAVNITTETTIIELD